MNCNALYKCSWRGFIYGEGLSMNVTFNIFLLSFSKNKKHLSIKLDRKQRWTIFGILPENKNKCLEGLNHSPLHVGIMPYPTKNLMHLLTKTLDV